MHVYGTRLRISAVFHAHATVHEREDSAAAAEMVPLTGWKKYPTSNLTSSVDKRVVDQPSSNTSFPSDMKRLHASWFAAFDHESSDEESASYYHTNSTATK